MLLRWIAKGVAIVAEPVNTQVLVPVFWKTPKSWYSTGGAELSNIERVAMHRTLPSTRVLL